MTDKKENFIYLIALRMTEENVVIKFNTKKKLHEFMGMLNSDVEFAISEDKIGETPTWEHDNIYYGK